MIDPDYFAKRREELGMERYDVLQLVQAWLDERHPEQVRAQSFNHGVLKLVVASSSTASELRLAQVQIQALSDDITRVQVVIGTLR